MTGLGVAKTKKILARVDRIEVTQTVLVGIYLAYGLQWFTEQLSLMIDQGLSSGIYWPGLCLLSAILFDALSLFMLRGSMPPEPLNDQILTGFINSLFSQVILGGSRWMITLMVLTIGMLGLGIETRNTPEPLIAVVSIAIPTLKEFFSYRWLFKETKALKEVPQNRETIKFGSSILALPMRLVLISLIEEGMFNEIFSPTINEIGQSELGIKLVLIACLTLLVGVLYAILIYFPTRSPEIIRMVREQRPLAWVPGFSVEVGFIVLQLLS